MSSSKKEFKEILKKWLKSDQEIKYLNSLINEHKKIKEKLNPFIINYMESKNKINLSINSNYQIKYNEINSFQGISKNYIKQKINEFIKDENASNQITDSTRRQLSSSGTHNATNGLVFKVMQYDEIGDCNDDVSGTVNIDASTGNCLGTGDG